jgi:hypothetical protein
MPAPWQSHAGPGHAGALTPPASHTAPAQGGSGPHDGVPQRTQ